MITHNDVLNLIKKIKRKEAKMKDLDSLEAYVYQQEEQLVQLMNARDEIKRLKTDLDIAVTKIVEIEKRK